MFIATAVASVVLALLLLASAWGKLTGDPMQTATLARVGVGPGLLPYLAAAEIAGALGLLAGLFWWPLAPPPARPSSCISLAPSDHTYEPGTGRSRRPPSFSWRPRQSSRFACSPPDPYRRRQGPSDDTNRLQT